MKNKYQQSKEKRKVSISKVKKNSATKNKVDQK